MRPLLTAIWTAMKDPLQGLIMLGVVCQGASADFSNFQLANWTVPFGYLAITLLCILWRSSRRHLSQVMELSLVALAIVVAAWQGGRLGLGPNRLVAVGHGLVAYQLLHLIRPQTLREQMWTAGVAVVHLVIGTQVLVDYRFVVILLGLAVVLIPRTLFQLEALRYRKYVTTAARGPGWQETVLTVVIVVAVFMLLPRFNISPAIAATGAAAPQQAATAGPMSEDLDTVGGGPTSELSSQLICRVDGERLGYLKVYALDLFDGRVWTQSNYAQQRKRQELRGQRVPEKQWQHRKVTVISPSALRTMLPSDGAVQLSPNPQLPGLYLSDGGSLVLPTTLRRQVTYDYWTVPNDAGEQLHSRFDLPRYTKAPPTSPELRAWLDQRLGSETDKYQQALKLTNYLRDNFTYTLGAPELSRLSPIDDFILHQKEGHCERFASALAVLLRMQGIPSRVGLGYMPIEMNQIGKFYNIRVRHGHAWTEAWFPNRGWVIMDATPAGREVPKETSNWLPATRDWIEYTWYSKVVEFSANDQQSLVDTAVGALNGVGQFTWDNLGYFIAVLLVIGLTPVVLRAVRRWQGTDRATPSRDVQLRRARSFYHRLEALLARDHLERRQPQTPLEFLRTVAASGDPRTADISLITETFCQVRYGAVELTPDLQERIAAALKRVARTRHRHTGTLTTAAH